MRLLLMRHAEAAPGYPDMQRQLTPFGLQSLSELPKSLAVELDQLDRLFVSPYLRTRQTLEKLIPGSNYQLSDTLVPESSPEQVCELLQRLPEHSRVLLVTHMPLVGWLSAFLQEGKAAYPRGFMPAEIEVLDLEYPAAGLGRQLASFTL